MIQGRKTGLTPKIRIKKRLIDLFPRLSWHSSLLILHLLSTMGIIGLKAKASEISSQQSIVNSQKSIVNSQ